MHRTFVAALFLGLACGACGSTNEMDAGSQSTGGSAGRDSGTGPDAEDAATPFPAKPPSLPQVVPGGGPVIPSPKVVPVFFEPDALREQVEAFLTALSGFAYWTAATQEYGVGALTLGSSLLVTTPPPSATTDDELRAWLASQADGTHDGWPKADANTIFALFYPAETSISIHGKTSCVEFDGYHKAGQTADGSPLVYAVLSRCSASLDALTVAASHEIIEAATDPYYYTDPAFGFTDDDHFVWTIATAGEVTDLCEFEPQVNAKLVGGYTVPRSFSNAAAALGHDPCVPAVAAPFFGAELDQQEAVVLSAGSSSIDTKGVRVPVGESRTVDVALFSDQPTEAIELQAFDGSHFFGGPKELGLSFDTTSGKNGDVVHLTITAQKAGAYGGSMLFLKSKLGSTSHVWLGFVAN